MLAGRLHDIAKPHDTRLWHRVAGVLLARFAPHVRALLAQGDDPFARYLGHARRGAALAARRGASPRLTRLIARHHEPPRNADERLLERADREAIP